MPEESRIQWKLSKKGFWTNKATYTTLLLLKLGYFSGGGGSLFYSLSFFLYVWYFSEWKKRRYMFSSLLGKSFKISARVSSLSFETILLNLFFLPNFSVHSLWDKVSWQPARGSASWQLLLMGRRIWENHWKRSKERKSVSAQRRFSDVVMDVHWHAQQHRGGGAE